MDLHAYQDAINRGFSEREADHLALHPELSDAGQMRKERDEAIAKLDRAQAEIRELESKLLDATTKPVRTCEACATYPCKCE